jgi:hypothetical protein
VLKVTRKNQTREEMVPTTTTYLGGPGRVIVGTLPDDVLLDIFYFCREEVSYLEGGIHLRQSRSMAWHTLVHVCRRWRYVVLTSPNHLNLFLVCTDSTPVREMLDIWPPLPILTWSRGVSGVGDNHIAALEQRDRVRWISLIPYKWGEWSARCRNHSLH